MYFTQLYLTPIFCISVDCSPLVHCLLREFFKKKLLGAKIGTQLCAHKCAPGVALGWRWNYPATEGIMAKTGGSGTSGTIKGGEF